MPNKQKKEKKSKLEKLKNFLGLKTKNSQKNGVSTIRLNPIVQPMSTQAGRGNMATEQAVEMHKRQGHHIDTSQKHSKGNNTLNPRISIEHEEGRNIISRRKMAVQSMAASNSGKGAGAHLDTSCKNTPANIKQMARATGRISIGMVGDNTIPPRSGDKQAIYRSENGKGKFVAFKPDGTPANAKDLKKAGVTINSRGTEIVVNERIVTGVTKRAKANTAGSSKKQKKHHNALRR